NNWIDTILNRMVFQKCMPPTKCTLFSKYNREEKIDIFFNTTWCRDRLFTSENPNDILKFYDTFSSRDELIQWMKERPKGRAEIIEVEGDKEIIVVIPTADFNGKYAKECRENIFKGLHIIFVESGFPKDPYFNYAHNCNVGIKKAIEYNPKWIVVSNDDMYKIDDVSKLKEGLRVLDEKSIDVVFTTEGLYHSRYALISERTLARKIILTLLSRYYRKFIYLEEKFKVTYIVGSSLRKYRLFYDNKIKVRYTGSFAILSAIFANHREGAVFDENYINGTEDIDLALRMRTERTSVQFVEYSIGDVIGGTIGPYDLVRRLRGLVNMCYMNMKLEGGNVD
ncbi:MAG: hypothetical protein QXO75_11230, partial [Nitrososphaerota archaeon]